MKGFRVPGGGISFSRSGAFSDLPITLSCGQCRGCRLENSRQKAVRCVHESQSHAHNCFITLTYDNINLPADESIHLRDVQTFLKRLRKHLSDNYKKKTGKRPTTVFKYFLCGEYGSESNRPHYHLLIFGYDFRENSKPLPQSDLGSSQYSSPLITEKWGLGRVALGAITFESAAYCARYAMKKVTGPLAEYHYQNTSLETGVTSSVTPEFCTMSKGIGLKWIEQNYLHVYPRDFVVINRVQARPPKYYDIWLAKYHPELWLQVQKQRIESGIANASENTPDRLRVRETVHNSKNRILERGN